MTPRTRSALFFGLALTTVTGLVRADDPPAAPTPTATAPTASATATATAPVVPQVGQNAQISATAEALFTEGRALLKDKKYAEACPKLAESLRLDPAIGTMLYLADCYEKNGQTASAWAMFNDAASAAHNANQPDREAKAKSRVDALAKKLVKLSVSPGDNASVPGLEVKRDGVVIGSALFGTAVPVDPGDHKIEVRAPGKKPWSGSASVSAKATSPVAFVIPRLEDLPPPPPPEPTVTATAVVLPPPTPTVTATATATVAPTPSLTATAPVVVPDNGNVRTIGLVVASVGVAGVAVAGVLGGLAMSKNDEALQKYCDKDFCTDQRGIVLTNDAKTMAIGSTVGFVLGGVTLATGAVLILYPAFAKPSSPPASARAIPRRPPEIVLGPGSLTVRGRF